MSFDKILDDRNNDMTFKCVSKKHNKCDGKTFFGDNQKYQYLRLLNFTVFREPISPQLILSECFKIQSSDILFYDVEIE
jgi:hypothetical protein